MEINKVSYIMGLVINAINLPLTGIVLAFLISYTIVPVIIQRAQLLGALDKPGGRKAHSAVTPTMGGLGSFISFLLIALICIPAYTTEIVLVLLGSLLMFVVGILDDLKDLSPKIKFMVQMISSILIVHFAQVRIGSLYGILGVYEMDVVSSYIISILFIVFITNAYNLLDGIDGLAGSIISMNAFVFSLLFFHGGKYELGVLALILVASKMGFLFHNVAPARIFMGDTGSLFSGFLMAFFSIKVLNIYGTTSGNSLIMVLSIVSLAAFDTFRVFFARILKGNSPFKADRNHVHHLLLASNMNHAKATSILLLFNTIIVAIAFVITEWSLSIELKVVTLLNIAVLFFEIIFIRKIIYAKQVKRRIKERIKNIASNNALLHKI